MLLQIMEYTMTLGDLFNIAVQWNDLKGLALRLLGIDIAIGVTTDYCLYDVRSTPQENVLIMAQVLWFVVYIGREDSLYG